MAWPCTSLLCNLIALSTSSSSSKSTKAKPRGSPVSRSVTTLTLVREGMSEKNSQSASSSTEDLRLRTMSDLHPSGFSPGSPPSLPLPLPPLPLPLSSPFGWLYDMENSWPWMVLFSMAMALSSALVSSKSTNARPREAPVSRSVRSLIRDGPVSRSSKKVHKSSSSTEVLIPRKNKEVQPSGFSSEPLPLPLPLPLPAGR